MTTDTTASPPSSLPSGSSSSSSSSLSLKRSVIIPTSRSRPRSESPVPGVGLFNPEVDSGVRSGDLQRAAVLNSNSPRHNAHSAAQDLYGDGDGDRLPLDFTNLHNIDDLDVVMSPQTPRSSVHRPFEALRGLPTTNVDEAERTDNTSGDNTNNNSNSGAEQTPPSGQSSLSKPSLDVLLSISQLYVSEPVRDKVYPAPLGNERRLEDLITSVPTDKAVKFIYRRLRSLDKLDSLKQTILEQLKEYRARHVIIYYTGEYESGAKHGLVLSGGPRAEKTTVPVPDLLEMLAEIFVESTSLTVIFDLKTSEPSFDQYMLNNLKTWDSDRPANKQALRNVNIILGYANNWGSKYASTVYESTESLTGTSFMYNLVFPAFQEGINRSLELPVIVEEIARRAPNWNSSLNHTGHLKPGLAFSYGVNGGLKWSTESSDGIPSLVTGTAGFGIMREDLFRNWHRIQTDARMLLYVGEAGCGKTQGLAHIVRSNSADVGAFFFFNYEEPLSPNDFVKSLVAQLKAALGFDGEGLSVRNSGSLADLENSIHVLHDKTQFRRPHDQVLVALDGLDELSSMGKSGTTILDYIATIVRTAPNWLRVVSSTRPTPRILRDWVGDLKVEYQLLYMDVGSAEHRKSFLTWAARQSLQQTLPKDYSTAEDLYLLSAGNLATAQSILESTDPLEPSSKFVDWVKRRWDFHWKDRDLDEVTGVALRTALQTLMAARDPVPRSEVSGSLTELGLFLHVDAQDRVSLFSPFFRKVVPKLLDELLKDLPILASSLSEEAAHKLFFDRAVAAWNDESTPLKGYHACWITHHAKKAHKTNWKSEMPDNWTKRMATFEWMQAVSSNPKLGWREVAHQLNQVPETRDLGALVRIWKRGRDAGVRSGLLQSLKWHSLLPDSKGKHRPVARVVENDFAAQRLHLVGHSLGVCAVLFYRFDVLTVGRDGVMKQWNVKDGSLRRSLAEPGASFVSATILGDHLVAGTTRGDLVVWDLGTGSKIPCVRKEDDRTGDDRVTGANPGSTYRTANGVANRGKDPLVGSIASKDALKSAVNLEASRSVILVDGDSLVKPPSSLSPKQPQTSRAPSKPLHRAERPAETQAMIVLKELNSGCFLSSDADGNVLWWKLDRGSYQVQARRPMPSQVTCMALISDDRMAIGTSDGRIFFWDSTADPVVEKIRCDGPVTALVAALIGGRQYLISAFQAKAPESDSAHTKGHVVSIWQKVDDGDEWTSQVVQDGLDKVRCLDVEVSSTGNSLRLVGSGNDKLVRLWRISVANPLALKCTEEILGGTVGAVNDVQFLPERKVATGGDDRSTSIWKFEAEKLAGGSPPIDPTSWPTSDFSVSAVVGDNLVTGDMSGALTEWKVDENDATRIVRVQSWMHGEAGSGAYVRCLAAASGGQVIASGGSDGAVRVWRRSSETQSWVLEGRPLKNHVGNVVSLLFVNPVKLVSGDSNTVFQWRRGAKGRWDLVNKIPDVHPWSLALGANNSVFIGGKRQVACLHLDDYVMDYHPAHQARNVGKDEGHEVTSIVVTETGQVVSGSPNDWTTCCWEMLDENPREQPTRPGEKDVKRVKRGTLWPVDSRKRYVVDGVAGNFCVYTHSIGGHVVYRFNWLKQAVEEEVFRLQDEIRQVLPVPGKNALYILGRTFGPVLLNLPDEN